MGRTITFTDAGINADNIVDEADETDLEPEPQEAAGWEGFEGPRYRFALLYGESAIWAGPWSTLLMVPEGVCRCRFCGTRKTLPSYGYCLGCDRCGVDALIKAAPLPPPPRAAKPPKSGRGKVKARPAGLKGGLG